MLIEFIVKNYRSIRDEQKLSLVATALSEHEQTHTFDANAPGVEKLLRSAVIYGANAAGKSNLLRALDVMQDIVLLSANESQSGEPIPVTPFLFDESANLPVMFEVIFVEKSIKYQYGFEVTRDRVNSEWLFAFPEKRPQRLFSRDYDAGTESYNWTFGPGLKGPKSAWRSATRKNSLFLSTANQLNAEQLAPIFGWFQKRLRTIRESNSFFTQFTAKMLSNDADRARVATLIKNADIGIVDFDVTESAIEENIASLLRQIIPEQHIDKLLKEPMLSVSVKHESKNGEAVWLKLEDESEGTQRLFSYIGPILDVLATGKVLVVDELNNSLHPLLVQSLVDSFNSAELNPNCAQLIFTTHATSILSTDLFRRDQIWFAEKDREGATRVYPLTDFSPRKDTSLAKGYLQGRFGAIPFLSQGLIQ